MTDWKSALPNASSEKHTATAGMPKCSIHPHAAAPWLSLSRAPPSLLTTYFRAYLLTNFMKAYFWVTFLDYIFSPGISGLVALAGVTECTKIGHRHSLAIFHRRPRYRREFLQWSQSPLQSLRKSPFVIFGREEVVHLRPKVTRFYRGALKITAATAEHRAILVRSASPWSLKLSTAVGCPSPPLWIPKCRKIISTIAFARLPNYRGTKKTPFLHEHFRKVRANFCLLPCDTNQEPNRICSKSSFRSTCWFWVDFMPWWS